ncbi:MAG TPA: PEP-CTERM sorting domain-containing protein [Stellaceae bacterium]|nr:PEP-CTERM sorting domain-containing protein [Stellaceae bacterium]
MKLAKIWGSVMNVRIAAILAAATIGLAVAGGAEAGPIDYIFTGTATGSLGGSGGNNASSGVPFVADTGGTSFTAFTVTLVADTAAVTGSVPLGFSNDAITATFAAGALTATFTLPSRVTENTSADIIIFGENQPSPVFFVAEGLSNATFGTYDLATALSLTTGTVSFSPQIFSTSAGDLEFDSISSMSFQAIVPEPATLALFGVGLIGLGVIRRRRRKVT